MQPELQVHDRGFTLLQQLSSQLRNAELLADRLGLADLAANQKFWQLRVLQLQQQDMQLLLLQKANAQFSSSYMRQPVCPRDRAADIDENECCFETPSSIDTSAPAAAACPSHSSPHSTVCQHVQQLQPASNCQSLQPQNSSPPVTETTQQRTLHRPLAQPLAADQVQQPSQPVSQQPRYTQQQHLVQQQQRQQTMHLTKSARQHSVLHAREQQQDWSWHQEHSGLQPEAEAPTQQQQQQQVPKRSHLQRVLCVPAPAQLPDSRVRDERLEALLTNETLLEDLEAPDALATVKQAGILQQHQIKPQAYQRLYQQDEQQQQQHCLQERFWPAGHQRPLPGSPSTSPAAVSAGQQSSGEMCSHQTSLLDTLAVAAAAVSQDPSAIEQPIEKLLSGHLQRQADPYAAAGAAAVHLTPTPGVFSRPMAAITAAPRAIAATAAGLAGVRAGAQCVQQQQYHPPSALRSPAAAGAPAHVSGTTSAAAGTADTHAAAAAVDSPNGSSTTTQGGQLEVLNVVAAEARGGAPYHKSSLLDLADQVGAAALAEAEAAVAAGRRLSYQQLMQLMRPLEERLGDVLGTPVKVAPGLEVQQVRRMFFFNQTTAARHFGMCATRFKLLLRTVGIRYWPQRQFMAIIEALNFLRDKKPDSRDGSDIPGRMLVLHHAWWLLNSHPNLQLDQHPASAIKKAIHKQTFKERKREKRSASSLQGSGSRTKGKRSRAHTEATQAAAAAALAAAAEGVAEEEAGSLAAAAAGLCDLGGESHGFKDVMSQLYGALAVWPDTLQYLAEEAAQILLLPPSSPPAEIGPQTALVAPASAIAAPAPAPALMAAALLPPAPTITAPALLARQRTTAVPQTMTAPAPALLAPERTTAATKVE